MGRKQRILLCSTAILVLALVAQSNIVHAEQQQPAAPPAVYDIPDASSDFGSGTNQQQQQQQQQDTNNPTEAAVVAAEEIAKAISAATAAGVVVAGTTSPLETTLHINQNNNNNQVELVFGNGIKEEDQAKASRKKARQEAAERERKQRLEIGTRIYNDAMHLIETSRISKTLKVRRSASGTPISSSSSTSNWLLPKSLLSDEFQKQKGILPAALKLVTQGFVSFFTNTPPPPPSSQSSSSSSSQSESEAEARQEGATSETISTSSESSTSSSTSTGNQDGSEHYNNSKYTTSSRPKFPPRPLPHHSNVQMMKAIELLHKAAYEFENDAALWTLAEMNFHSHYRVARNLTVAFDMYSDLADRSGHAAAQYMVGFYYSTGLGNVVERDEGLAILYTTFAAQGNHTAAEMTMGYRLLNGIGTRRSCQDAVFYYKRAADKAHAQYLNGPPLGRTMPLPKLKLADRDGGTFGAGASGSGYPPSMTPLTDVEDFLDYHRFLAKGDSTEAKAAQFQLGLVYYTGKTGIGETMISRNFKDAAKYLEMVADSFFGPGILEHKKVMELEKENPMKGKDAGIAAALLGRMYWRGEGFEVNEVLARKWFQRGAWLNNPVALNGLASMMMAGAAQYQVTKDNVEVAGRYFKQASDLNYPDAQVNMGLIYLQSKGIEKDHRAARNHFEAAAGKDNFQAIYHLADMHYYGLGGHKRCDSAVKNYKFAAEQGDWQDTVFQEATEAFYVGDLTTAAILYLMGAEQGYDVGQLNFAWLLDQELPTAKMLTRAGFGLKAKEMILKTISESSLRILGSPSKLLEMALVYWTRSANQGDVDARVKMGDYYFAGVGTTMDPVKALACYQVAADMQSSAMAMWNLGWMYENGIGVRKDFYRSKYFYDSSLATNPGAYLPVSLSLVKLQVRYFWNYLIGGDLGIGGGKSWFIGPPPPKPGGGGSEGNGAASTVAGTGGGGVGKTGSDGKTLGSAAAAAGGGEVADPNTASTWDFNRVMENVLETWKSQQQNGPGDDGDLDLHGDDPDHHHRQQRKKSKDGANDSEDDDDEEEDDDLVEGLVIIGLCMVVGYLMYLRQFRFGWGQVGGGGVGAAADAQNPGRFAWAAAGG